MCVVCVCVCVRVRACVRACVRVRACVCVCASAFFSSVTTLIMNYERQTVHLGEQYHF